MVIICSHSLVSLSNSASLRSHVVHSMYINSVVPVSKSLKVGFNKYGNFKTAHLNSFKNVHFSINVGIEDVKQ